MSRFYLNYEVQCMSRNRADSKADTGIKQPNNTKLELPVSRLEQLFTNISDALKEYQKSFASPEEKEREKVAAKQNDSLKNLALALSFLGEEIVHLDKNQVIAAIPEASRYGALLDEKQLSLLIKISTSLEATQQDSNLLFRVDADSKIHTGDALKFLKRHIPDIQNSKTKKLAVRLQDSLYKILLDNRELYIAALKTLFTQKVELRTLFEGDQLLLINELRKTVNAPEAGQNSALNLGISCIALLANLPDPLDQEDKMMEDLDDRLDGDNLSSDSHSPTRKECDTYLDMLNNDAQLKDYVKNHNKAQQAANKLTITQNLPLSISALAGQNPELKLISTISSPKKNDASQKLENEILEMVHNYGLLNRKILVETKKYSESLVDIKYELSKKQSDILQQLRQAFYLYEKNPNSNTLADIYLQYHTACINAVDNFYKNQIIFPIDEAVTEKYYIQKLKSVLATPAPDNKDNEGLISSSERLAKLQFTFHQHKKNLAERNYPIVNLLIRIIERIIWGYRQITDRSHHKATFFSLSKNIHRTQSSYKNKLTAGDLTKHHDFLTKFAQERHEAEIRLQAEKERAAEEARKQAAENARIKTEKDHKDALAKQSSRREEGKRDGSQGHGEPAEHNKYSR